LLQQKETKSTEAEDIPAHDVVAIIGMLSELFNAMLVKCVLFAEAKSNPERGWIDWCCHGRSAA